MRIRVRHSGSVYTTVNSYQLASGSFRDFEWSPENQAWEIATLSNQIKNGDWAGISASRFAVDSVEDAGGRLLIEGQQVLYSETISNSASDAVIASNTFARNSGFKFAQVTPNINFTFPNLGNNTFGQMVHLTHAGTSAVTVEGYTLSPSSTLKLVWNGVDWIGPQGSSISAITDATASNTINNANYAQTWNWATATSTNALSLNANSLTTGALLNIDTGSASSTAIALNILGSVALRKGSDFVTSSAYGDNVDFGNASLIRVNATTSVFLGITGIANGSDGELLTIINASSTASFILYNQNSSSTAANRIITGTGGSLTVSSDASILLAYDSGASVAGVWLVERVVEAQVVHQLQLYNHTQHPVL
jgi:hypothetical protein